MEGIKIKDVENFLDTITDLKEKLIEPEHDNNGTIPIDIKSFLEKLEKISNALSDFNELLYDSFHFTSDEMLSFAFKELKNDMSNLTADFKSFKGIKKNMMEMQNRNEINLETVQKNLMNCTGRLARIINKMKLVISLSKLSYKDMRENREKIQHGAISYKEEDISQGYAVSTERDLSTALNDLKQILKDSPFEQYVYKIMNLCFYYKHYNFKENPEKDFFTMHHHIFEHIHSNPFDDFINNQLNYVTNKRKVKEKWNLLKQFVQDYCKDSSILQQEPKDHFCELLSFLVSGDHQSRSYYQAWLREYVRNSTRNLVKRPRHIQDVATVFLCLVLDLPTYKIKLTLLETMEMRILKTPIKESLIFDHDVMYIFSKYDPSTSSYAAYESENASVDDDEDDEDANSDSNWLKICLIPPKTNVVKLTEDEELEIIDTFKLGEVTKCIEFTSLTLHQSMAPDILKCMFSIFSIVDMILDLILAYNYLKNNEIEYFALTVVVLFIAGVANVTMNEYFEKKYNSLNRYYEKKFNKFGVRCLLSFFQLSAFLKTLTATKLYFKRNERVDKKEDFKLLVDNIIRGHPEYIEDGTTRLNFVEMFFETRLQTILQIYIVLKTQSMNKWQLMSIVLSILLMVKSTLAFVAMNKRKRLLEFVTDFYNNLGLLLREICYFGFSLILSILLVFILSWYYIFAWIFIRLVVSLCCDVNREGSEKQEALAILGCEIKSLKYWTFFTYWTIVEVWVQIGLILKEYSEQVYFNNGYFTKLYVLGLILYICWFVLVCKKDFRHPYNVMYIPWHMRNSRLYPAQAKGDKKRSPYCL